MAILCIGDSLTRGQVGYSYLPFLNRGKECINAGVNGDTTLCMTERLQDYLHGEHAERIDTVIVGIGTNDLLLPYLTTISPLWEIQMSHRCKRKRCITDDREYLLACERIMQMIQNSGKRGIILGIPFIQLEGFPLHKLRRRNSMLRSLAQKYGFGFIDTSELARMIVPYPPLYSWKWQNLSHFADSALMGLVPPVREGYAKKRKLILTVDGVHFSRRMAKTLAACIRKLL